MMWIYGPLHAVRPAARASRAALAPLCNNFGDFTVRIVTFTTDFGGGDGYAGAMKGVVLSLAPAAQLVDITHGVPPMDVAAGPPPPGPAPPRFPPRPIPTAGVDPRGGGGRARTPLDHG